MFESSQTCKTFLGGKRDQNQGIAIANVLVVTMFCSSYVWRDVVLGSHLQMFTDGLTNKLMGGWKDGCKEDLVLVRSSEIVHFN